MPVKIRRKKGGCYSVSTPRQTHAKCTTKERAEAQGRLLRAVEHGYEPSKARKLKRRTKRRAL